MSNDIDPLLDGPSAPAGPATVPLPPALGGTAAALATPDQAAAPALWLAIYKPGAEVQFEGEQHKVSYVHISKKGLFVRLSKKEGVVPAEKVNIPLTRVILPLRASQTTPSAPPPPLPAGSERSQ